MRYFIGLGSNLSSEIGDSRTILQQATHALSSLGVIKVSKLYQSPPMGPQDQPDYFNAVVQLDCELAPLALLDHLQQLEREFGRVRLRHWGERTLDLDIVYCQSQGEQVNIQNERIIVPHVGVLERDFVVLPLLDLDADFEISGQVLANLPCAINPSAKVIADQDWYKANQS